MLRTIHDRIFNRQCGGLKTATWWEKSSPKIISIFKQKMYFILRDNLEVYTRFCKKNKTGWLVCLSSCHIWLEATKRAVVMPIWSRKTTCGRMRSTDMRLAVIRPVAHATQTWKLLRSRNKDLGGKGPSVVFVRPRRVLHTLQNHKTTAHDEYRFRKR